MPLAINPQSLQQLNGLDPLYWPQEQQWLRRGGQMDESTLAETLAKAEHERKLRPIDFQQKEATLNQTLLGNATKKLENQQKQFEIDYYVNNQAKIDAAKLSKLLGEADEAETKMFYSKIERAMTSGDPKARALWDNMPEQIKAKLKQSGEMAQIGARKAADMELLREREKLRLAREKEVAGIKKQVETEKAAAKTPKDLEGLRTLYLNRAIEAKLAGDEDKAAFWNNESNDVSRRIVEEIQTKIRTGQEGKPDIGAVTDLPTRPVQPNPYDKNASPAMNFVNEDEVGKAYQAGKISREEALKILKEKFGKQ